MKIGVYDSGIGGLSVLQEIMLHYPQGEYCYYADTDHVPYGEKSRAEVVSFAREAASFLLGQGVAAIVVACNTATSAAIDILRREHSIPIVGMEPAVKPALRSNDGRRVLLLATPLTLQEAKLQQLLQQLDPDHCVDLQPMPQLVRFAERGEFDSEGLREYCRCELAQYAVNDYSAVVLGCTHFNYFKDTLRELFPPHTAFIDGCGGTARYLLHLIGAEKADVIAAAQADKQPQVEYFFSGRPASAAEKQILAARLQRLQQMREI